MTQVMQKLGNQLSNNEVIVRCRVGLTRCLLLLLLFLCCNVDGQQTSQYVDTSSQQFQAAVIQLLSGIVRTNELIAAQQQEIVREMQQTKQELNILQRYISGGCISLPRDCYEIKSTTGANSSGVYTIFIGPTNNSTNNNLFPLSVYCDMETDGGGWTVFQRRRDGSEDFYRTWNEYADGFGDLNREFWLGNNYLFAMTRTKRYKLRFDLADFDGNRRFAEYQEFKIGSAYDKYRLGSLSNYSGDAGNSFGAQVGQKFSTHDQDNDACSCHCSVQFKGAWWYDGCHGSNLNGYYYGGNHTSYADGVNWYAWRGYYYSLRFTEMKIRPY